MRNTHLSDHMNNLEAGNVPVDYRDCSLLEAGGYSVQVAPMAAITVPRMRSSRAYAGWVAPQKACSGIGKLRNP